MARRHLEFGTAWGSGLTYPSVRDREGLTEEIADWKGGRRTEVAVDAEFRDDDRVCYNCFYLFYAFLLVLSKPQLFTQFGPVTLAFAFLGLLLLRGLRPASSCASFGVHPVLTFSLP
jgi:hypothetical protein